jgi:RES domain-containing protein
MLLWRLSGRAYARVFDGGYGLLFDGRWNSVGHAITYGSTSPALCVLEKLVHVQDPNLLPELTMVRYEAPDAIAVTTVDLDDLPDDWRLRETSTQQRGDDWHRSLVSALMRVPSAIVPLRGAPDVNVLINHRHPASAQIRIVAAEPFVFDARLL